MTGYTVASTHARAQAQRGGSPQHFWSHHPNPSQVKTTAHMKHPSKHQNQQYNCKHCPNLQRHSGCWVSCAPLDLSPGFKTDLCISSRSQNCSSMTRGVSLTSLCGAKDGYQHSPVISLVLHMVAGPQLALL